MKRTIVRVFRRSGAPFFQAQWFDPLTGKRKRLSTGHNVRREAERFAAKLETDINEGRQANYRITWADFRIRYEQEVVKFKAANTKTKVDQAFNHVEKHISPKFLISLDAGEISKLSAKLADDGLVDASIASVLRTLKAAVRWARRLKLLPEAPSITMPSNADKAGGRAVTAEEFERWIAKARESSGDARIAGSRVRMLQGLWWGGLRLREALRLHWIDDRFITVSFRGKRPMFDIKSEADKGRKDRRFPMAPEFAEMLESVPGMKREGFVLEWLSDQGNPLGFDNVCRAIGDLGQKAGIVVDHDKQGKPVFATAHDLRRSFGTRWAKRVFPPVLKQLMRHASIATTMKFYVDIDAEEANEALYDAISKVAATGAKNGATRKAKAR